MGSMTYQLVFRNASYTHDYVKFTLTPFIAMSAATAWVYERENLHIKRFIFPVFSGLLVSSVITGGVFLVYIDSI